MQFLYLLPIGIIGLWRWGVWLIRKIISYFYEPIVPTRITDRNVSIITPVYNEEPDVFMRALYSWRRNSPSEIVAVIDYSDQACIDAFKEYAKTDPNTKLIVTQKPGKRPALVDGIKASTSEIVILVDSDTIWADDVLQQVIAPFADRRVGGVGTRQNVLSPDTFAQRLFDIHLDNRYLEEIRFLAAAGDAITCISGRTAAYRRSAVMPVLDDLMNEKFWGKNCISGDDKRLTHLVQGAGWRVRYQENAQVFTPGFPDLSAFMKQRLRWTRNSWRADLRAMYDGWVWRKPALAFHLVDRLFPPFTTLLAPIYFGIVVYHREWLAVIALIMWWLISRGVKIFPHVKRRPSSILMLPAYIVMTFILAVLKIYALFTLNEQGWITRWDKSRLGTANKYLRTAPAVLATFLVVMLLSLGMVRVDAAQRDFVEVLTTSEQLIEAVEAPNSSELGRMLSNGVVTVMVNEPCAEDDACEPADPALLQLIKLGKSADLTQIGQKGNEGFVLFTYTLENNSAESLEITEFSDSFYGNLDGQGDCLLPQTIEATEQYICTIKAPISPDAHNMLRVAQIIRAITE